MILKGYSISMPQKFFSVQNFWPCVHSSRISNKDLASQSISKGEEKASGQASDLKPQSLLYATLHLAITLTYSINQ